MALTVVKKKKKSEPSDISPKIPTIEQTLNATLYVAWQRSTLCVSRRGISSLPMIPGCLFPVHTVNAK